LFVFGLLLFGLACLAGGLAVTPAMLMAARAVQVLGRLVARRPRGFQHLPPVVVVERHGTPVVS
ncbi:MFS transporter, partial [Actinomadura roseirufa]|uniref:MFS transporter n=1 Tax=Actinomadura roseirufa TaxID=2094049 RepID=UPI0013F174B5